MKKAHEKFPIYLSKGLEAMPKHTVYALASSKNNRSYFYIGTSTRPVERYEKYARAVNRSTFENHESDYKIDTFRDCYEPGVSPVMLILDSARNSKHAKELERYYREKYTNEGHPLINPVGKSHVYAKTIIKRATNDAIDTVWSLPYMVIAIIIVIIGIVSYFLNKRKDFIL